MYQFQVKMYDEQKKEHVWKSVRPTKGKPYEYKTHKEAFNMMKMCYPLQILNEEIRVIEKH